MLLDSRTFNGFDSFQAKFIRIGNEIYFIGPEDKVSFHIELAQKHRILDRIGDIKTQNPEMLDGGMMYVSGRVIRIGDISTTLSLPINETGRKNTIIVLRRMLPSFSIKELTEE